jgi:hypothetical protein
MNAHEFWSWFEGHAPRFLALRDDPDEAALDDIQEHLHSYCDDLWFEVGGAPEGPMEFVISAEGNEAFFRHVQELADAAPSIPGWQIIAFKPPHGFSFVTNYGGLEINPAQCWFLPLKSKQQPGRVALRIGVPGYDEANARKFEAGLHIVVDAGLGELVAGQRVAFIEACDQPVDAEQAGFIRLDELGDYIAWMARQTDV